MALGVARDCPIGGPFWQAETARLCSSLGGSSRARSPCHLTIDTLISVPVFYGRVIPRSNGRRPSGCRTAAAPSARPISFLVDVIELLHLDRNRPLHVFDPISRGNSPALHRAKARRTLMAGRKIHLQRSMTLISGRRKVESHRGGNGRRGKAAVPWTRPPPTHKRGNVLSRRPISIRSAPAYTGARIQRSILMRRYRCRTGIDRYGRLCHRNIATQMIWTSGGESAEVVVGRKCQTFPAP